MGFAAAAVDDGGGASSTPPKLSLLNIPSKVKLETQTPGTATPPLRSTISIPFQWEEEPGKPRLCDTGSGKPGGTAVRCLELPPRLLYDDAKVMPSPTTVLDGPYTFRSASLRKGGSFRSLECKEKVFFGSSRWASFRKGGEVAADSGFNFFPSGVLNDGDGGGGSGHGTQVRITRVRRKGSLFSLHSRSDLWASIYTSLKQVVPWRRGQEKIRTKTSSSNADFPKH
ncbi:hypothetical protein SLE2022_374200 [Rubroshorea leprosula]